MINLRPEGAVAFSKEKGNRVGARIVAGYDVFEPISIEVTNVHVKPRAGFVICGVFECTITVPEQNGHAAIAQDYYVELRVSIHIFNLRSGVCPRASSGSIINARLK